MEEKDVNEEKDHISEKQKDRRRFLKKLGMTAAISAPIVLTLKKKALAFS